VQPDQPVDTALVEALVDASERTNVPFELLAAIAHVETRLRSHEAHLDHGHHPLGQIGVMALTPEEASRGGELAGVGAIAPLSDDAANIAAAAALLAELAGDVSSIDDWHAVLIEHRGKALADEVFEKMARGFAARALTVSARADLSGWERERAVPAAGRQGYPSAIWNPAHSSNYSGASRGAAEIDYVVVHTVQGSYAGAISWFKNSTSNVSAHYVVRSSDGEVTQMVDDSDVAWHDACFNSPTVGIEHEGWVDDPETWYTEAQTMASARLLAYLAAAYDIPIDRDHIYGHGDAPDCSTHTDPGPGWDWDRYLALARDEGMPELGAAYVGRDFPSVMRPGEEAVVWFELDNLSNITWGLDETRLGTAEPNDRASAFFVDGNWMSPARATGADHSSYGPGDRGRFTFLIRAPEVDEPTTFTESFQLVQDTPDGDAWFGDVVTASIEVIPEGWEDPGDDDGDDRDGDDLGDPSAGCQVGGGQGGGALLLMLLALIARRRRVPIQPRA
jgi:MYXO-CTERM domain-containing protein